MISIIVPIYNVAEYLPQCIDSICCQTYDDLEIILVDDGSTDESPDICDEYAKKDRRIRVIHKENAGPSGARKTGIAATHGEYISCVDSDDWIETDMLQKLMDIGAGADIIVGAGYEECTGYQGIKKNTVPEGLYSTKKQCKVLYGRMLMNGNFFEYGIQTSLWGKLFKKDVFEKYCTEVADVISYGEDTACIYPCILASQSVYVSNLLVYHYRVRKGSIVRSAKVSNENFRALYKGLKLQFDQSAYREVLDMQLRYYMWQALLLKGYERIDSCMVLFPFGKVKHGMRVAVYGAGLFGQVIENYCRNSKDLSMTAWFDKHYEMYLQQGLSVRSSDEVINIDFDLLVIAILNVSLAKCIKADLVRQGLAEDKIDFVDTEILDRTALPQFCLYP